MLNLMLHCGARAASREQIEYSPTPERTQTWVPIPHARMLDLVERTVDGFGFQIQQQAHALWGEGKRYFGLMELTNGHAAEDYGLVIGLRNSHDKSFPAGIAIGNQVFCCDNLSFFGDVVLARKHTRFIERDLPGIVNEAVGRLNDLRVEQDQRVEAYKTKRLQDKTAHDIMVRAIDNRVMPVTALPTVLQEWKEPQHEEFRLDGKTAWRLFNAFTEGLKGRSLTALPRRSQRLHGLLDRVCDLVA
jgi:hypothetical protein